MTALVSVEDVRKVFRLRDKDGIKHAELVAVDGVSLEVESGAALGIVGESGSGKTTLARMIVGLERQTSGVISIDGRIRPAKRIRRTEGLRRAREVQIVAQDPFTALDPLQRVDDVLEEVLRLHFKLNAAERRERVKELLGQVGLDARLAASLPRQLSGGQRQRVVLARALAAEPRVLVLDEPTSALDVSIQAQVLNLLADIRAKTGLTFIFVTHDLGVVSQVTDSVIVMKSGKIVERGPTSRVLLAPKEEYTRLLLSSVPRPGWQPERQRRDLSLSSGTWEHAE